MLLVVSGTTVNVAWLALLIVKLTGAAVAAS